MDNSDYQKLREEDIEPVKRVADYLEGAGFDVSLSGSAVIGDKNYDDVDILAQGEVEHIGMVVMSLGSKLGDSYQLVSHKMSSKNDQLTYSGRTIEHRMQFEHGQTKIDVSIAPTEKSRLRNLMGL